MLERESKVHIHPFKPLKSKTIRLQTVAPLFEAGRVHFIEGEWTAPFVKELCAFPLVPHDDKTDAVVWLLTYYAFHLVGVANTYTQQFSRRSVMDPGRKAAMEEFTELVGVNNEGRNKWRRKSLFDRGDAGEVYRLGQSHTNARSDDLKFDTGL